MFSLRIKYWFIATAISAVVVITSVNCESQVLNLPRVWPHFDGTHCETTKAELDLLAERAPQDTAIIIIARLGTGEYSRILNRRRLEGMRHYLEMTRGISKDRLIIAEGSRVNGLGQVDFYVSGKLFLRFTVNRNKDLTRGCSTA
jgi:hypothetical protein